MSKWWNVTIEASVSYEAYVEAENEAEAKDKAMSDYDVCGLEDLTFWNTRITDVYEDDQGRQI